VFRLHHILEALERANLDDIAGRFGLEHALFTGEGVGTLAGLPCWLALDFDFAEARDGENLRGVLFEVVLDHSGEAVKNFRDFFFAHAGVFGEVCKDIGLGTSFLDLGEFVAFGGCRLGGCTGCGFLPPGGGLRFFSSHCGNPSMLQTTIVV